MLIPLRKEFLVNLCEVSPQQRLDLTHLDLKKQKIMQNAYLAMELLGNINDIYATCINEKVYNVNLNANIYF